MEIEEPHHRTKFGYTKCRRCQRLFQDADTFRLFFKNLHAALAFVLDYIGVVSYYRDMKRAQYSKWIVKVTDAQEMPIRTEEFPTEAAANVSVYRDLREGRSRLRRWPVLF